MCIVDWLVTYCFVWKVIGLTYCVDFCLIFFLKRWGSIDPPLTLSGSAGEKGCFLFGRFDDILHALNLEHPFAMGGTTVKRENFIRWEAPLEGWALLNTDGASKGNPGVASGGGVLRGHRGDWIKGFTEHFRTCTSVKTELRAALRSLRMARELGMRKVWLRVDSMIVVGMLRRTGN